MKSDLLKERQQTRSAKFDAFEFEDLRRRAARMAYFSLAERGDCLLILGRLNEAQAAYEECVRRAEKLGDERKVAVTKSQLGSVRIQQGRYPEALAAFKEAAEWFTRLDEPGSMAAVSDQTGRVYHLMGQPDAAEDAYRKSLATKVRLGDVRGQANTLVQLGHLYGNVLNRLEEAAAFYRQAVDRYVQVGDAAKEGTARSNLAGALHKLRRWDEARQEIFRAIECEAQFGHVSQPWKSWSILADIEIDAANPTAAEEARHKAIDSYLAYRRDGGENHNTSGRISLSVTQYLLADDHVTAASFLEQFSDDQVEWFLPFVRALQAIVVGSRDRTLADSPDLNYMMAAEILVLIETLETRRR